MSYVLLLAGWYPTQNDKHIGDFVKHHAEAIANHKKVVVLHITKSAAHKSITHTVHQRGNLIEWIVYYPAKKILDKVQSQISFEILYRKYCKKLFAEFGNPLFTHVYIAWKAGIIGNYLFNKYNIPFILTDQSSAYLPEDLHYVKKFPIRFKKLKSIFNNAKGIIAISNIYYQNCAALFNINCPYLVIQNTVDTNFFHYKPKPANAIKQLIHISTMDYPKNIEGLLAAIFELKKTNSNFKLILVGPIHENNISLVKEYELGDVIEFTGMLAYEKVANYLQNADLKILFSRFEGLPSVLLESFCCGVPVISTNVGGIAEIVNKNNGLLVANNDTAALSNHLVDFLNGKNKFNNEAIANEAKALYSHAAIGKRFIEAYNALLEKT